MSIIQANASVTHTYGNIAALTMDHIMQYFAPDYFKKTHISTKLAHRQLDIYKTKVEFWKLKKPMFLMRPRIETDDSSLYFYGSAYMNRVFSARSPMEFGNLVDLLVDKEYGTKLSFLWNRAKIYFDVVIIVSTLNEQLNLANFMRGYLIKDTPYMVNANLESFVPKTALYPIADFLKIDRNDTATLLQYLNTYSKVPFTYKLKDGSGNDEFFALYNTNIEMIPSEISLDDGSTKGLVDENYTLSFTMSAEFDVMAFFYTFLADKDDQVHVTPHSDIDNNTQITNLFTIPLLYDMTLDAGWKILSAPSFFVKGHNDTVELGAVIPEYIGDFLKFQQNTHQQQSAFFKIRIFRQRNELEEGVDYEVDMQNPYNPILKIYKGYHNLTYRAFILIDAVRINEMVAEMTEFNKEK